MHARITSCLPFAFSEKLLPPVPLMLALLLVLSVCGCAAKTEQTATADSTQTAPSQTASGKAASGQLLSLDEDDLYLENDAVTKTIADPLEGWNRFWFSFNDIVITYVATPVNKAYTYVMPKPIRTGIGNFFHNITTPKRFLSNVLQGKPAAASAELGSLIVNSTVGIGGLFNIAKEDLGKYIPDDEDTGQAFGKWGIGEGFYIVWPFLGPSNLRDSFGLAGDYFLNPITYLDSWEWALALGGLDALNSLDDIISTYETFKGIAVEPYSALRDGYTQYRRAKIAK